MSGPDTPAPAPRRVRWRAFVLIAIAVLAIAGVLGGVIAGQWLATTPAGLRWLVRVAAPHVPGALEVIQPEGRLVDGVRFQTLVWRQGRTTITASDVRLAWRIDQPGKQLLDWLRTRFSPPAAGPSRLQDPAHESPHGSPQGTPHDPPRAPALRLRVTLAEASRIVVQTGGSPETASPSRLPERLTLPVDIDLDALRIGHLEVGRDSAEPVVLAAIGGRGQYRGETWTVEHLRLDTPWAEVRASGRMHGRQPYALSAGAQLEGSQAGHAWDAHLDLGGTLGALSVAARWSVDGQPGTGRAELQPLTNQPLVRATLAVRGVSPKLVDPAWPEALIDAELDLAPAVAGEVAGHLVLANRAPATLDRGGVPVGGLSMRFAGRPETLRLTDLRAELGRDGEGKAGLITGSGTLLRGRPELDLAVRGLDLRGLQARLVKTRLDGRVVARQDDQRWRFDARLSDATGATGSALGADRAPRAVPERQLAALLRLEAGTWFIDTAEVRVRASRARLTGRIEVAAPHRFVARTELSHLRPRDFGDFGAYADADLSGMLHLEGALAAAPQVSLRLALEPSRWRGQPLTGTAQGRWSQAGLSEVDIRLALGSNRVLAQGAFGAPDDRLEWRLDLPQLTNLAPDLAGAAQASGVLQGGMQAPQTRFDLRARNLLWRDPAAPRTLAAIEGGGVIELRPGGTLNASLTLRDARVGATRIAAARLAIQGTAEVHRFELSAQTSFGALTAQAAGQVRMPLSWQGRIAQFAIDGPVPVRLGAAPGLAVAAAPGHLTLGNARLQIGQADVHLGGLEWQTGALSSRGRARNLPMPAMLLRGGRVASDLRIDADWDLRLGASADGTVRLRRTEGDLRFPGAPPLALGLQALAATVQLIEGRVQVEAEARGTRLGTLQIRADSQLNRAPGSALGWTLDALAPLQLSGRLALPDLAWVGRLAGVEGLSLAGHAAAEFTGSGSLAHPVLGGGMTGSGLEVRWAGQGVDYRNGSLAARFAEDRLVIDRLRFAAGEGEATGEGSFRLAGLQSTGDLRFTLRQFLLLDRADRQAVASGTGTVQVAPGRVSVAADVRLERGLLRLGGDPGVTRSADVVVMGRDGRMPASAESRGRVPPQLDFAVRVDFGERFRIAGNGVEGRLTGALQIRAGPAAVPDALGTLNIVDGVYQAYGQNLSLTRGVLNFSGPLTNPGLDILAVRRDTPVEAGVQVRGTAAAPLAQMVSTPDVPDTEKLSWLVLGHGQASGREGELAALSAAAASLVGGSGGPGLQARLAAALGIDELRVAAGQGGGGILTLGKRLSSALYVSFEQGLGALGNVLRVHYDLSRRWAVELRTGTENAVDVLFAIRFD